eukprot:NODE_193_length_15440_cov_0.478587.p9 type:complete len:120 gc:universal NODE_193_length_15440_cov_0.478587:1565-1206(-)
MSAPRNLFDDMREYISNSTFKVRSSVYHNFKDFTKDIRNPLLAAEQYAFQTYENAPSFIIKAEQQNIVPSFWIMTVGSLLCFKVLPRHKFIAWLTLTTSMGYSYFPKSIEKVYKEISKK